MGRPARDDNRWLWDAAKVIVLAVAIVVAVLLLWQLSGVLLLVFGAILVATLLRAAAAPIERFTPLSRRWAVIIAALLIGAVVVGFLVMLGDRILAQAQLLIENLPSIVAAAEDRLGIEGLGEWLDRQRFAVLTNGQWVINVAGFSTSAFSVAAQVLVVVAGGIYFALAPQDNVEGLVMLVPESQQALARDTLVTVGSALRLWLLGQLVAMAMVGTLVTAGLWLLGVQGALVLGLIAGLFDFVPLVGPVAAAVPAVVVGLADSPATALWVAGLYFVVQQIETIVITPLVQQYSVELPPILTLFAIFAFGTLLGPLGVLVATPLAVVGLVVVKKLWMREVLREDVEVPGEEG
ncbi:AI-2E family transporter [Paracoccus sp. Z118]|uniref:AI-2E family transporter n=1 Tax=Paracoccus sp. Z118 TaxID=2851017 RepID=UPI001C2CBFA1|nr:AI-2E family transporter [Paracoccus sp. Z118]MBV0890715.1 AI-2E family transporter [Paracoccus sp. Z118]